MTKNRRSTEKTGKYDKESPWAKARLAQCLQYQSQLSPDYQNDIKEIRKARSGAEEVITAPRMSLDSIVWWDEKHKQCVLGCNSKFETRLARNVFDGSITDPKYGGKFGERMPRKKEKYPKEARACFGVAVKSIQNLDTGECEYTQIGIKCEPFSYTGRKVYSPEEYERQLKGEFERVKPLKGNWGSIGAGYTERYGFIEGRRRAKEKVDKTCCNVTDIMDHVVRESKKVYQGIINCNAVIIKVGLKYKYM